MILSNEELNNLIEEIMIREILSSPCDSKIDDTQIHTYKELFFKHILKRINSCSAGTIFVNTGGIDFEKTVLNFTPNACHTRFHIGLSGLSGLSNLGDMIIGKNTIEYIGTKIDASLKKYMESIYPDKIYTLIYTEIDSSLLVYLSLASSKPITKILKDITRDLIDHWPCYILNYSKRHGIIEAVDKYLNLLNKADNAVNEVVYLLRFNNGDVDDIINRSKGINENVYPLRKHAKDAVETVSNNIRLLEDAITKSNDETIIRKYEDMIEEQEEVLEDWENLENL